MAFLRFTWVGFLNPENATKSFYVMLSRQNCTTLHWLPVSQRITFKIALMIYDCIHGRSPVYFHDICSPIVSVPFRSRLRSADNDDMIVPRTRTARYGPRSFPRFGTCHHLISRTVVLVANSSSRAFVQAYS